MATATFVVGGMECEGCANAIKRSLAPVFGIRSVTVDLGAAEVKVDYDAQEIDPTRISNRIDEAGYKAEILQA